MDIKVLIATHRDHVSKEGDIYLPVFVGAAVSDLNLPYQRDDEGENISDKNLYYSELTAMYWAYKNLRADYIGLCHYHRFMSLKGLRIEDHDIVLPCKRHYYIETIYDQYSHAHGSAGLDTAREVISEYYPDYLSYFDKHMKKRAEHNCNMFIMKYDIFISYCDWLFDILFKIEAKMGKVDRLYGYISERLLDVFITRNNYEYVETRVIETEYINWPRKIFEFLKRKYSSRN